MVDIIIGHSHRINKLDSNNHILKNKVFKGRIVGIRKARKKHGQNNKRDIDGKNAKAFIIVVDYDEELAHLVNKRVEIRIL